MATLKGNTIVSHPETGVPTVLLADSELPGWADGLVGDHLLEGEADEPSDAAPKGNASRDEWADYAKKQGAPDEETRPVDEGGLKQAELRDKYGK